MARCFNENILLTMKTENPCDLVRIKNKKIFVIPQYFGRSNKKVSRRVEKIFYCSIFQYILCSMESSKKDSRILDVILNNNNNK